MSKPPRIVMFESRSGRPISSRELQDNVNQELASLAPGETYELTWKQKATDGHLYTTVMLLITQRPGSATDPDIQDTV